VVRTGQLADAVSAGSQFIVSPRFAAKLCTAAQRLQVAMLRALGAPFPDVRFCPTGGIALAAAREDLAEPNVLCIGMSSVAPPALLAAGDWAAITALARQAVGLR
jgi:2-dehydro-3-deoxyphosphogluconate aldolase/(4S)-4-hydroxy-2-oxoglutarate aldolase